MRFHPSAFHTHPHPPTYTHTGLSPDIVYTVFVTSDLIPVEEVFILARGGTLVQATDEIATGLVVGLAVSFVAVVIAAIAVILCVIICIACVYHKKRVRKIEIELKELQVNANPSYRQAIQFVETDASSDGQ